MNLQWKTSAISTLLIFTLAAPTTIFANHHTIESTETLIASTQFKDVKADHYAYEAIQWAQSKGIVSGYGDGRFGPNDAVTEAQFVKMITNYFNIKDTYGTINKSTKNTHWSDSAYDALAQHALPLNGYFDNSIRNKPIKRGLVAQVLTNVAGYRTDLQGSIEFLLDNNVTSGQNPQYKDSDLNKFFGVSNNLTRSQVVAFLYRMELEGLNRLSETIDKPNGKSINELATTGKKRVDNSLSQGTIPNTGSDSGIIVIPNNPVPDNPVDGDVNDAQYYKDNGIKLEVYIADYGNGDRYNINIMKDFEKKISNTINTLDKNGFVLDYGLEESLRISKDDVHFEKIYNVLYYNNNSGINNSYKDIYLALVSDYFDVSISNKEFENARLKYNKNYESQKDILIKDSIYYTQSSTGNSGLYKK